MTVRSGKSTQVMAAGSETSISAKIYGQGFYSPVLFAMNRVQDGYAGR